MPYEPEYRITPHLLRVIEDISALKTRIETAPVSVLWLPRLSKEAFSKMTYSSTAIEGNPLSLKEVEILAEGGALPQARPKDVRGTLNYLACLKYISRHSQKKAITKNDILLLHKMVGEGALERDPIGAFRPYQVYVGGHVPPKPKDVPGLVDDLLKWLNGKGRTLSPVISSAILHYRFEFIHPFGDGNGRAGRLLATWELYRRKFDTRHIFSVDEVFWENRKRYYVALAGVEAHAGDLTGWLEFSAECVELALERVWMRLGTIKAAEPGTALSLNEKQERILRLLAESPLSRKEIETALKVTKQGALFLLRPLLEAGLVKKVGGYKTGKYRLV